MLELRPYQNELIVGARQHFRAGRKSVLIQLATGGGKTAICARMLHNAINRGKRAWFCVHRRELAAQVSKALSLEGVEHGLVMPDAHVNLRAPVQVCSIPTLVNRFERLPEPDLIAFDECHHIGASSWYRIMKQYSDKHFIGLSATPQRLDGIGMGNFFSAMVCGPQPKWLIEQGYLCNYKLYAPETVDRSQIGQRAGKYITADAERATQKVVGDAVSHYRKHIDGAQALLFAVSVKKSKELAELFNAAGIPALHIDGRTDDHLRDAMMTDFMARKVKVICNVGLFSEGYDCPALDAVMDLAPTMSMGVYRQRVGRMFRPSPGKEYGHYLDCVGNSEIHGKPDDDIEWDLTTGAMKKKKNETLSPRICGYCFAQNRAGSEKCRLCKRQFPVSERVIEQVDGELAEVTAERVRRNAELAEQGAARTLESLTALGVMRYGPGKGERWAAYVFAARQKKRGKVA